MSGKMIIETFEQRTPEWFKAKAGVPSASGFDKIVDTKGRPSKQAAAYAARLAGERMAGIQEDGFESYHMKRGKELEEQARLLFELVTGEKVTKVGLCYKDENKKVLCSPDGLIKKKRRGLELKCPDIHTHVGYIFDKALPGQYFQQVQGSMYVTGYKKWYFASYYPGLPLFYILVERDENFIAALDAELNKLYKMIDDRHKALLKLL